MRAAERDLMSGGVRGRNETLLMLEATGCEGFIVTIQVRPLEMAQCQINVQIKIDIKKSIGI